MKNPHGRPNPSEKHVITTSMIKDVREESIHDNGLLEDSHPSATWRWIVNVRVFHIYPIPLK